MNGDEPGCFSYVGRVLDDRSDSAAFPIWHQIEMKGKKISKWTVVYDSTNACLSTSRDEDFNLAMGVLAGVVMMLKGPWPPVFP